MPSSDLWALFAGLHIAPMSMPLDPVHGMRGLVI